jgi:hypothetical protein
MVSRWGNEVLDELDRGSDGPDTNFLVLATSPEIAAVLANKLLSMYSNKDVQDYCEHITMLGIDSIHSDEAVIHGPSICHAFFFNNSQYKSWELVSKESNEWVKYEFSKQS